MTEVTDLKRPLDEQENLAPAKKSKPSHDGIAHIKPEFIKPINTFQDYENNDDDEGSNERLEDNGGKSKKFKKKKAKTNRGKFLTSRKLVNYVLNTNTVKLLVSMVLVILKTPVNIVTTLRNI